MKRKIITIDVSELSQKEMCVLLGMKYTPWYKDFLFWSIVLLCSSQFCVTLLTIMKGN